MTKYPIKVRWTGDARTKLITREIEPSGCHNARNTLTRQKTNLVVENDVEKAELLECLNAALRRTPSGTVWMTPQHKSAFERVRSEIREQSGC
jgi:hypothetical protein